VRITFGRVVVGDHFVEAPATVDLPSADAERLIEQGFAELESAAQPEPQPLFGLPEEEPQAQPTAEPQPEPQPEPEPTAEQPKKKGK
jgi:hypothetical protein